MKTARITHLERFDRRKQIAQEIANGLLPAAACRKFRVSANSVRSACAEFGVPYPSRPPKKSSTLQVVARLLKGVSQSAIAEELGVSPQFVSEVASRATKAGIAL